MKKLNQNILEGSIITGSGAQKQYVLIHIGKEPWHSKAYMHVDLLDMIQRDTACTLERKIIVPSHAYML